MNYKYNKQQENAAIITAVKSFDNIESDCHVYGSVNKEV